MANSNFSEILLGLERSCSQDDRTHPLGGLSDPTINPLDYLLPNPLHSEITTSPSSQSTNTVSPPLTEEEEAHVDNLLYHGVDSPVLPSDLLLAMLAGVSPDLASGSSQHTPTTPTTSQGSPLPVSSAFLFSPTTAYADPSVSPPTLKRRFSLVEEPNSSQDPPTIPGPSAPPAPPTPPATRPAKRQCTSYPGENSFQLDPTVAPLKSSQSAGQPMGRPRAPRTDYSACRCPDGLTSKPARHWRACPYNPESRVKRFACDLCGTLFTREDNMKRHMEDYH